MELLTGKPPYDDETGEVLHQAAYEMLCDPTNRLAPLLDARSPWPACGRVLELCLVAKRCLESHVSVRGTMREAMPKVVALAAAAGSGTAVM